MAPRTKCDKCKKPKCTCVQAPPKRACTMKAADVKPAPVKPARKVDHRNSGVILSLTPQEMEGVDKCICEKGCDEFLKIDDGKKRCPRCGDHEDADGNPIKVWRYVKFTPECNRCGAYRYKATHRRPICVKALNQIGARRNLQTRRQNKGSDKEKKQKKKQKKAKKEAHGSESDTQESDREDREEADDASAQELGDDRSENQEVESDNNEAPSDFDEPDGEMEELVDADERAVEDEFDVQNEAPMDQEIQEVGAVEDNGMAEMEEQMNGIAVHEEANDMEANYDFQHEDPLVEDRFPMAGAESVRCEDHSFHEDSTEERQQSMPSCSAAFVQEPEDSAEDKEESLDLKVRVKSLVPLEISWRKLTEYGTEILVQDSMKIVKDKKGENVYQSTLVLVNPVEAEEYFCTVDFDTGKPFLASFTAKSKKPRHWRSYTPGGGKPTIQLDVDFSSEEEPLIVTWVPHKKTGNNPQIRLYKGIAKLFAKAIIPPCQNDESVLFTVTKNGDTGAANVKLNLVFE